MAKSLANRERVTDANVSTLPTEPNPIYNETVYLWNRIKVHTSSKFPESLFKDKAPNETQEEFDYRRLTFKSNTKQDWGKATGVTNRVWNEQNYSLSFNEDDSFFGTETMTKYVIDEYPRGDIINYFKNVVTKQKNNDPNGVICVKPLPAFMLDDDGQPMVTEEGAFIFDDRNLIEPVAYLYHSDKVMDFVPDVYALILTGRRSVVNVGGQQRNDGLVFEFYDDTYIYEVRQFGDITDYKFETFIYYKHDLGELPAFKLKGVPVGRDDNDGYQIYESPFYPAVDLLDTALYNYSTLQASIVAHAYLQKWEYLDECITCNGDGLSRDDLTQKCNGCNGTGHASKASVLGVYGIKTIGTNRSPDDAVSPPPAGFIQKDPTILEFLDTNIDKTKKQAFAMVNIDVSSKVNGTETATGRYIDREEMYSFLMLEASQNFDLLNNVLWAIGLMRYGSRYNGHTLTTPNQFDISTAYDLTEEIAKARESNIPSFAIAGLTNLYIATRFSSLNTQSQRAFKVVNYTDGLAYMTNEDIIAALNTGSIAKWQTTLHYNIQAYLSQQIDGDADFLDKELPEIKQILDGMAQADQASINPQITGEQLIQSLTDANTPTIT